MPSVDAHFVLTPFKRRSKTDDTHPDLHWFSSGTVVGDGLGGDARVNHNLSSNFLRRAIMSLEYVNFFGSQDYNVVFSSSNLNVPLTDYLINFADGFDLQSNLVDISALRREYSHVFFSLGPGAPGGGPIGFIARTANIANQTFTSVCGGYVWLDYPPRLVRYFPA